jgi:hypothetical protein
LCNNATSFALQCSTKEFYELPAVQQLSSKQLLQLLQAAVAAGKAPRQLCKLPVAAGISREAVVGLVQNTARLEGMPVRPIIETLLTLPVLGQVTPEVECELLWEAWQAYKQSQC